MNTRVRVALVLTLLGSLGGTVAGQEPYAILIIPSTGGSRIAQASVDTAEIVAALGLSGPDAVANVRAFLEVNGILQPLVAQMTVDGDRTDAVLLLPEGVRKGRVQLYGADVAPSGDPATLPDTLPPLTLRREDGRVIVNNGFAEIVHDPAAEGGLPSRISFLASGKAFDGFDMYDRLYDKDRGQFFLRNDRKASVKVVRKGPLEIVVEAQARYVQGDNGPVSQPQAVYRFAYRVGSPAVEVTARCEQATPASWHEHHLLQWQFNGRPLPTWTGSTPRQSGAFDTDNQSANTAKWGAVTDGA
ncbi:MAG: hypothetical protein GY851_00320, partial [bacterium]|nr:hypothetical protein [bacterium]